jgi:prepilin-type N-terminal cleavage/methylation domain-containing protein
MRTTKYEIHSSQPLRGGERIRDKRYSKGYTLIELLVALIVSSIILAAVATLALAMSSANDASDDTSIKQAQVRYATLRVSELVRHCKLICGTPENDLAVWKADDNGNGLININELVYIERGSSADYLRLCEFPASATSTITLSDIETLSPGDYSKGSITLATLIPQCSNVTFLTDAEPPMTKFLSISFDLVENNAVRHYQINTALRGWAGNLLNAAGTAIVSDDD